MLITTRTLLLIGATSLGAACVTTEKSENPLSPSVAGPLPGVSITPPEPAEPHQGVRIPVGQQPITLSLENAVSTGVRPLSYRFELATDVAFTNIVLAHEGIAPGEGRTSFRLPDALAAERSYYWRGRAQDGANTGPFSHWMVFTVFTPVVIGKPTAISPAGTIATVNPSYTLGNSSKSGPVGQVFYVIEVSSNPSFATLLASWILVEQAGARTTLASPGNLPANSQLYWRVAGYDSNAAGPWSDAVSFRTPAPSPGPTPGPTPSPGCPIPQPTPFETLQCARAGYPHPMNGGHRGALMNQVAWAHRNDGWGMHKKTSGNLCPQPHTSQTISCDILVHGPTGSVYDVLIDEEIPTWGYKGPINTMANFVPPVQP